MLIVGAVHRAVCVLLAAAVALASGPLPAKACGCEAQVGSVASSPRSNGSGVATRPAGRSCCDSAVGGSSCCCSVGGRAEAGRTRCRTVGEDRKADPSSEGCGCAACGCGHPHPAPAPANVPSPRTADSVSPIDLAASSPSPYFTSFLAPVIAAVGEAPEPPPADLVISLSRLTC